jgi:hypothetical protein
MDINSNLDPDAPRSTKNPNFKTDRLLARDDHRPFR